MIKKYYEAAAIVLLLGLFPALFLPTLQLTLLIVLIGLLLSCRHIDWQMLRPLFSFRYMVFAQFYIFFFMNALIYPVWDNPKMHYRAIVLESWSLGLFCLGLLGIWLNMAKAEDVKRAIIHWLPYGLTVSFLIASGIYFFGNQGLRVRLFTPNPLVPPFWFLVFVVASFAWFFEMNRGHKAWRIMLFFMAGMMVVYGGTRLVMLAWILCGVVLIIWGYRQSSTSFRLQIIFCGFLLGIFVSFGAMFLESAGVSSLIHRMAVFSQVEFSLEGLSAQFPRFKIWMGVLSVIGENPLFGVGQVNERLAIQQELAWSPGFRAHQTYLSYLVAGGIPALISGIIMQSSALAFMKSAKRSALFPVFLGLGVVVTLNCTTDSIFQSAVSVQVFMVTTLLFLRACDADQPTLAPQKHVSSAII